MELSRLSLIGLAGYGFLLKEFAMHDPSAMIAAQRYVGYMLAGAICLGASTAFALATRELSVHCLGIQIRILRTITKIENGNRADDDRRVLQDELGECQSDQRKKLARARWTLRLAHYSLIAGTLVTVLLFGLVLFAIKPKHEKDSLNRKPEVLHLVSGNYHGQKPNGKP